MPRDLRLGVTLTADGKGFSGEIRAAWYDRAMNEDWAAKYRIADAPTWGDKVFFALLGAVTAVAVAVPGLIVWWLVASGLFSGVAALAAAAALWVWLACLFLRIFCGCR